MEGNQAPSKAACSCVGTEPRERWVHASREIPLEQSGSLSEGLSSRRRIRRQFSRVRRWACPQFSLPCRNLGFRKSVVGFLTSPRRRRGRCPRLHRWAPRHHRRSAGRVGCNAHGWGFLVSCLSIRRNQGVLTNPLSLLVLFLVKRIATYSDFKQDDESLKTNRSLPLSCSYCSSF